MHGSRRILLQLLGIALVALSGCASNKVLVPPRIELLDYGRVGIIEFASEAPADLRRLATHGFMQTVQSAQPGVPILELGPLERVLASVQRQALDLEAIRAIGSRYGVDTVVVGELDVSPVKPNVRLTNSFTALRARAEIEGMLDARFLETESGATFWTSSARGTATVAHVDVLSSGPASIGAADPDSAHGRLVRWLVNEVTVDLRPRWVKP